MKIIFLSAFQSFVARNILNTGVLDELLSGGNRVVLFVPSAKREFYERTYSSQQVFVEAVDVALYENKKESFFANIAELLISTNVMRHRKIKRFEQSGRYFKYLSDIMVTAMLGRSNLIKCIFRKADLKINNQDIFGQFIHKYNPDVVFATDTFSKGDIYLLKSAKIHSIRSIGMVASWDNNTTKGLMRVIPETLLVQNEIIKEESIKIQAIPKEIIKVVGIAHYDFYKEHNPISRNKFFEKIGVGPEKRLIVFSPAGSKFISTDWQVCQILKEGFSSGSIPEDVVILIRVHPTNPIEFGGFEPGENFIVEKPGLSFPGLADKRKELDKAALLHLLDTLNHADLIINVVSSIVIDAAIFNKPVITIGFEGWEREVPFGSSVKRYHLDENMAKLLALGGTKVVYSKEDLFFWIKKYLQDPSIDKEGRERIVKEQCWKLDGQAKLRIKKVVLNF